MKDKKKTFIFTICFTLCMCAIVILIVLINSLYPDSRGLEYKINADNTTCTITGLGTYSSKDLVIPDAIDDYEVTAIANYAFKSTDIETVSGGNNVTQIGRGAFQRCEQLFEVIIPGGVTKIENDCFDGCENLSNVSLPYNLTKIGDRAFQSCVSLESIAIPNKTETIGVCAFFACIYLENIVIPDSVTNIGDFAFFGCQSLENITFPSSVVTVGVSIIGANYLTTIDVDKDNPVLSSIDGNLYYDNNTIFVDYAGGKQDSSFDIPNGVIEIGMMSFCGCFHLKTISIPNSVKHIGIQIFSLSPNIETIYYDGTVEDWRRIDTEDGWKANTESIFTIICTDGTIAMDGKITYN